MSLIARGSSCRFNCLFPHKSSSVAIVYILKTRKRKSEELSVSLGTHSQSAVRLALKVAAVLNISVLGESKLDKGPCLWRSKCARTCVKLYQLRAQLVSRLLTFTSDG